MPRIVLNFQHYRDAWSVHFIEADCRTIGPRTRFYTFTDLEAPRSFLKRCTPDGAILAGFDRSVRAWGRGSDNIQHFGSLSGYPRGRSDLPGHLFRLISCRMPIHGESVK
jgi:hypothetical protein